MFLEERQAKILEMLEKDGKVLVKELAEIFGVTEDSIRKDLSSLEFDGKLKRTYGGAVTIEEKLQMTEANRRRVSDVEAKRKIAAAAVKLISPQDLVFLDISTISIAVAEILAKSETNYKIITNMVDVLVMLARNPKINLYFVGGQINQSRDGFSDVLNIEFVSKFRPDISFIGVFGADIKKNSLSSRDTTTGIHKAKMIELSKSSYITATSNKIGREGTFCFCSLDKVDGIITDAELSKDLTAAAKKLDVKIISAA
ncbi:MAG: DeoR/GlpR family DNA-binding transcription regulator [Selenomonadaceae bacterium]|nr:DeoR/GlpR family DNA-binding transcription regulator [Selenomonadaceae bacterium]